MTVKLDFLKPGVKYEATIYADGPDACGFAGDCFDESEMAAGHYPTGVTYNPYAYTITKKVVTSKSVLKLRMASCGGFAVSIREK